MRLLSTPYALRISGMGGQGNILMGLVFAKALVKSGFWVIQTQHYGAQVRGGLSYCDVLFSDVQIDFPKAETFDILYIMHEIGLTHLKFLRQNGILFVDTSYINVLPQSIFRITKKVIKFPAAKIAEEKLGKPNVANMVGLGIISKVTGIIKLDKIIQAMKEQVREHYHEINEKALKIGYEMVEKKYTLKRTVEQKIVGRGFE